MARRCKHGKLKTPVKSKNGNIRICKKRSSKKRRSRKKSKRRCSRGMRKGTRVCRKKPGRKRSGKKSKRRSSKRRVIRRRRLSKEQSKRARENWMKVRDNVLKSTRGQRRARAAANWRRLSQKAARSRCPEAKKMKVVCSGNMCRKMYGFSSCKS